MKRRTSKPERRTSKDTAATRVPDSTFGVQVWKFGVRSAAFTAALRLILLCLLWHLAVCAPAAHAQGTGFSEYDVKAVTLFKFVQFIKWPPAGGTQFTIGVVGNDPFGGALDRAIQGESVGGKKLAIKRARRVEDLKDCQVVFVPASERANVAAIVASLAGKNILTVGEHEGFAKQGGAIGFTSGGGKVGFEINHGAARSAGLEISSRLLKLAGRVVGP